MPDFDAARAFVPGNMLSAVIHDFFFGQHSALFGQHNSMNRFTPFFMGDANDGAFGNGREPYDRTAG